MKGFSATSTKSVQDARHELTKFIKTLQTVPIQILSEESKIIYSEAVSEAPYRTGKLEKSLYVRVSRDKRRPGLVAGASARTKGYNYSGIQHENKSFRHPIKGKDHFISDPFYRSVRRVEQKLKARIRIRR